jgi:penicillin-binding protein 1C
MPGKSPIRISNLHRRVLIDRRTGGAVCDEGPNTSWQVIEYWPSDMQRLFREAGMPRRDAPHLPECARTSGADARMAHASGEPQIVSPLRAVTYTTRLSKPVALTLKAEAQRGKLFWFSNEAFIGEAGAGEAIAWQPPKAGRFVLRVVDEAGNADSRDINVEMTP